MRFDAMQGCSLNVIKCKYISSSALVPFRRRFLLYTLLRVKREPNSDANLNWIIGKLLPIQFFLKYVTSLYRSVRLVCSVSLRSRVFFYDKRTGAYAISPIFPIILPLPFLFSLFPSFPSYYKGRSFCFKTSLRSSHKKNKEYFSVIRPEQRGSSNPKY